MAVIADKTFDEFNTAEALLGEFLHRFDQTYLELAYHASFPFVLTPELVSYLRTTFLHDKVPWIAEIDLLLSDICRPIGYEKYIILPSVRSRLLTKAKEKYGAERVRNIAYLLIKYTDYLSREKKVSSYDLQFQRWASSIYLPELKENVIREIAQSFKNSLPFEENVPGQGEAFNEDELYRLVKITEEFSPEIAGYPQLLEYAVLVGKIITEVSSESDSSDKKLSDNTEILGEYLPPLNPLRNHKIRETYVPEENVLEEDKSAGEMDFGAILEQFEQEGAQFHPGDVVQGKVIGVSDNGVIIDFGYKSEGVADIAEFTTPDGEVTVKRDDEVEVIIKTMAGPDGSPVLSYADARRRKSWDVLEEAFEKEEIVTGRVVDRIKGGVKVDLNGVEAFLPASQIDSRPVGNLDEYIGQNIEAKIIKFSRRKGNVVLSRKVIVDEVIGAQKQETLSQLEEGYIVEGKVKSLTEYGVFVDIGGIDALLHVTDIWWGKVQHPADVFKVGESVQAKILKIDKDLEKVSLGLKQLTADPWTSVEERYPVGTNVKGKVSSLTDYGAFVELEPGVEGLIHISEMSWSKRSKHPNKILSMGQEVEVRIVDINPTDRRISLSLKQLMINPWDRLRERYQVGTRVTGKVRNMTDFGVFVEIEDGVDGLVHVSDISWSKRIKHPKDALKNGQEIEAVVTNIDIASQRMSLSIKDLTPSTWDSFVQTHKPGDVVKGKISRLATFGVFVELGEDLEGLCHISELSDEKVDKPEDVVQIGQEMDFKILRIDAEAGKIGLSARAVGKEDEPEFDVRPYSTEAKGGMASLAELANLHLGNSEEEGE